MDESSKYDVHLENLESTFENSDYSNFNAGQSSQKRAKYFEKRAWNYRKLISATSLYEQYPSGNFGHQK